MAERKYSGEDQQKILKDFMNDANAKGCDFKDAWVTAPDGAIGAVKEMKKDFSYTKDQSQGQTEHNSERTKNLNKKQD